MNIGNLRYLTALVLLLVSLGCVAEGTMNAKSVLTEINAALSKGDGPEVIEGYFKNRGLAVSYDRFSNRYQSIIRNLGGPFDHAVVIMFMSTKENGYCELKQVTPTQAHSAEHAS
jgi:hypothetical protein